MKVVLVLVMSLVAAATVSEGEEVLIPWEEFKSLYRDRIDRTARSRSGVFNWSVQPLRQAGGIVNCFGSFECRTRYQRIRWRSLPRSC